MAVKRQTGGLLKVVKYRKNGDDESGNGLLSLKESEKKGTTEAVDDGDVATLDTV